MLSHHNGPVSSNVRPQTKTLSPWSTMKSPHPCRSGKTLHEPLNRPLIAMNRFLPWAFLASCTALAGCATPTQYTSAPMLTYDKDTEYSMSDRVNGFDLTVNYSRYQFIPESSAVAVACKSALTSLAHEHADKKGRKIKPLNEQRIRISMGRNGLTGITSCSAQAVAEWEM